jgi:hypothetical protein
MKRLLIFLFLIGLSVGCKSAKKATSDSRSQADTFENVVATDTVSTQMSEAQKSIEEEEIIEEIRTSFVPLDSAGITVFKPETIQVRKSRSTRQSESSRDTSKAEASSSDHLIFEADLTTSQDLNKEMEAPKVIEQGLSALFPNWAKIISSLAVVLIPVIIKLFKSKNQAD